MNAGEVMSRNPIAVPAERIGCCGSGQQGGWWGIGF